MRHNSVNRWVRGMGAAALVVTISAATSAQTQPAAKDSAGRHPRRITDEQRAQLKQLRTQLDSGVLTPSQFAAQADGIIGDRFLHARRGPAARRAAFLHRRFARASRTLQLTDAQKTDARELFKNTQHQIRRARLEAHARIRLALTAAQRTQLDDLRSSRKSQAGKDKAIRRHDQGGRAKVAAALQLTDEQKASIKDIRSKARDQVKSLRQAARGQFESSLTDEQRGTLKQLKHKHEGRQQGERAGKKA